MTLSHQIARNPEAGAVLTKAALRAADRLGLSGRQLADIVGVSEATVSRWKRGEQFKNLLFVRKCREDSRAFDYLGKFYAMSDRGLVADTRMDLSDLARELGVLR